MKKVLLAAGLVLLAILVIRSCSGSPEKEAKGTVAEFVDLVKDGEGKDAVKLLYPPFRDALVQEVKLPVQLTEMKPSELLACALSSMGENIKKVKVVETRPIDDKHVEVLVRITDRQDIDKLFSFIVIKDEKGWKIASISPVK
ncbi:hypothetical protein Thal_1077 [Thermocrinis albus DSM 14484]|uniref:DUF4878 domain-containing protein n=1 Tax=Thermocrinis albus (strain DSM 14484 / JCM 11386 / HI 11/12) TaxID=638303 RepID=D3SLS9_THEAH|nr:DUF4878 domain-containing protein [Thermocrinis albus]ADC89709.1 hypothetical protein Thal_1077 [Thermocrinis albus DSM 14484]